MEVPVYDMSGTQTGTMSVDEVALGERVNPALIKQAYVRYHANRRQGSARSKSRSHIRGSTAKMYRQKGTGRARHGDRKATQMRGGAHYKNRKRTREDYRQDMPKKMRRKANRNALLAKLVDAEVKVIDGLSFAEPKTRAVARFLGSLGIDSSALLALSPDADKSRNARLGARNLDTVAMCRADQLNCFEMLNSRYLVIDKGDLEAWLAGPSSQTGKDAKLSPLGRVADEESKSGGAD